MHGMYRVRKYAAHRSGCYPNTLGREAVPFLKLNCDDLDET